MSHKWRWAALALFVSVVGVSAAVLESPVLQPILNSAQVDIDLSAPDAWVDTASLSRLPRAVIQAPLLQDLLSEDFAFYYQDMESRLDVAGAFKRLAFEHALSLPDRLVDVVFDEPAELALWQGQGGRPGHWLLAVTRNGIAKALQELGQASLNDRQLRRVGSIRLAEKAVDLFALQLDGSRTLLFASQGDRLLVLSSPGMLLAEDGKPIPAREELAAGLLEDRHPSPFARHFSSTQRQGQHRVTLSVNALSRAYGRLLTGLEAISFATDGHGWQTEARLDRASAARISQAPWSAMPFDAAFCIAMPVHRGEADAMLADLGEQNQALAQLYTGATGACWYDEGGWQAPLFAARLADSTTARQALPALANLFGRWIGAREFSLGGERFPVRSETGAHGESIWRREVSARYGELETPVARRGEFSSDRYFDVTLALAGDTVLFSPSADMVDKALSTVARQYPALGERMPPSATVMFTLDPARLATFLTHATQDAASREGEAIQGMAENLLLPRYQAAAKRPAVAAVLPGSLSAKRQWVAVDWQPLK